MCTVTPNLQTGDLNQDAQLKEVVSVQCLPHRVPNEAITPVSLYRWYHRKLINYKH